MNRLAKSQVAVRPALDHADKSRLVVLDRNLSRGFIKGCVSLDKDLAGLLVLQHHIPHCFAPEFGIDSGHLDVEITASFHISSRLINVELLEVIANSCAPTLVIDHHEMR